ncbi:MAG: SDR family NAD(P)-dependent oxidoreductase, partial [Calditrichaeota bacterium]|nr:SDR family NAD(P)-dependent oxidoreductase [Calditrichota bacterium]
IELIDLDAVKRGFNVNVFAVIDITQQLIPLLNQKHSKIINISSKSGRIAMPFTGAYAASKFALEAISDALRRELSITGIKVVVVQPGAVRTPIWEKADQINLDKYTGSRYETVMAAVKERVIEGGRNGADPHKLAELIYHIIQEDKPKNRYIFAKKPFMEIRLLRLLPARWLDRKISQALYGKKNS